MQCRCVGGLINQVNARAGLVLFIKGSIIKVKPGAVVQRHFGHYLPLILQIQANEQRVLDAILNDSRRRRSGQRIKAARIGAVHQDGRRAGVGGQVFIHHHHAPAQGVFVAELVAGIGLQPGGIQIPFHIAGHAVEEQVPHGIRGEMHRADAAKRGDLHVEIARRLLICDDAIVILLVLIFIQRGRVKGGARRPWIATRRRVVGRIVLQSGRVGDLEIGVGGAAHRADAAGFVHDVGQIGEGLELIRNVMNRSRARGRVLNAEGIVIVTAVHEVVEVPLGTTQFEAGHDRVITAAIHRDLTAGLECPALGVNVHDPRGAESILGRQRPGDQARVVYEAGAQFLAKSGNALRQQHVVDAVLDIGVLAPEVQVSVRRRVLYHARGPQQHLIECGVIPTRQGGDLRLVHRIDGRSQIRDNLVPRDIQLTHHRRGRKLDDVGGAPGIGAGWRDRSVIGLGDGAASTRHQDRQNDCAINPANPGVGSTVGRARSSRTKASFHTMINKTYVSNPEFLLTEAGWLL